MWGSGLPANIWDGNAMSTQPALRGKLRTILDCVLVFLLILVASANHLAAQAKTGQQPAASDVLVTQTMTLSAGDLIGANPGVNQPLADNNTLAGMIAAENAALTLPIHFIDLPLVTR